MVTQSATDLARRLDVAATTHKRLSEQHRNAARLHRELLDDLIAFCKATGIPIEVAKRKEQSQDGQ